MPRDYVRTRPRRYEEERSRSSGVVWLLLGILIGLIIAGIFYVKNQNHAKSAAKLTLPELQQKVAAQPSQTTSPSSSQPASTPTSPQHLQTQFDFYNVLPNQKVTGPSGDEDTANIQNPSNTSPAAATSPTPQSSSPPQAAIQLPPPVSLPKPKPSVAAAPTTAQAQSLPPPVKTAPAHKSSNYIVQVASLKNASDADALKAQLTLLGFDVKTSHIKNTAGIYYRVWIGPFHTDNEAEAVRKQLQENMISGKVLKSS